MDWLAAVTSFSGQLVPACQGGLCVLCDFVTLVDNTLKFLIALSVMAAALMFAYAGFLYFTASANSGNLDSAQKTFTDVFIGLVIVLIAWVGVDLILRVFTNQSLNVLSSIQCVRPSSTSTAYDLRTGQQLQQQQQQQQQDGGVTGTSGGGQTNPGDTLSCVHPDLVKLVNAAHGCSEIPFVVTSGKRDSSSTSENSRHLYGLAVDVHPIINGKHASDCSDGGCRATPSPEFIKINEAFQCASQKTGIKYDWGGADPNFMQGQYYDAEHFHLPRSTYADSVGICN